MSELNSLSMRLLQQLGMFFGWGFLAVLSVARAEQFPWLNPANTQVIVLNDPRVDIALRIAAIDRARATIEMATYAQGVDEEVGVPLLQALRRAQNRGVEGNYLISRVASYPFDRHNLSVDFLADASLKKPGTVLAFGGPGNWRHGLRITDMNHMKILIIDAGTPNEVVFFGGRNNNLQAIKFIDSSFIFRRIDPSKPYIGDQIREMFFSSLEAASKVQAPVKRRAVAPKRLAWADQYLSIELKTKRQRNFFAVLNRDLSSPIDPSVPPKPYEDRPEQMRALSNDLLARALTGDYGTSLRTRKKRMPSDIVEAAANAVAIAKRRVILVVMSVFLAEKLKNAVKQALNNGVDVTLVTNSRQSAEGTMFGLPGLPYFHSLDDIMELMNHSGKGKLRVFVLNPDLLRRLGGNYSEANYLHRKLVVVDDDVFGGSDNFNLASMTNDDEAVVESRSKHFADRIARLVSRDLKFFERLSCEQVLTDLDEYDIVKRGINWLIIPLY